MLGLQEGATVSLTYQDYVDVLGTPEEMALRWQREAVQSLWRYYQRARHDSHEAAIWHDLSGPEAAFRELPWKSFDPFGRRARRG